MSIWEQTLILFFVLQVAFGWYEYRINGNIIIVIGKLFQPKYLIPTAVICGFYALIGPLIKKFLAWFFRV